MPPEDTTSDFVSLGDAFNVPVFVRYGPSPMEPARRPSQSRIDRASAPWPGSQGAPGPGAYRVLTTWRDVLDAAMTVGRDPLPWLAAVPSLASAEIIARRAPLAAYLHRTACTVKPGAGGNDADVGTYQLEPNAVYREGTEKTARGLFAYRIGMTMAEWACRGLMGLGPTIHAEATTPPGYGPMWSSRKSQPDLVGYHWQFPQTWLVEAKGQRKLGKTRLRDGARQLSSPGLMDGPHMRVLCGTSIEHRIFMTIDIESALYNSPVSSTPATGRRPTADDNDDELLALASSRMLTYYALQAIPRSALAVRPVGPALADENWPEAVGHLVRPLEDESSTVDERSSARDQASYARRPAASKFDMLTGRVPGTDLLVGMSRRLFAACRRLGEEHAAILAMLNRYGTESEEVIAEPIIPHLGALPGPTDDPDEEAYEERIHQRRTRFAEIEDGSREYIRGVTRQAYEEGHERQWQQLINFQPLAQTESLPGLLESATADTYIAIDTRTPPADT